MLATKQCQETNSGKHYWPGATFELPWDFSCEDCSTPWGVLVLLSSKPRDKSFLGALTVETSSVMPICFCLLRFLLHNSWQSCHKGRLEKSIKLFVDSISYNIHKMLVFAMLLHSCHPRPPQAVHNTGFEKPLSSNKSRPWCPTSSMASPLKVDCIAVASE